MNIAYKIGQNATNANKPNYVNNAGRRAGGNKTMLGGNMAHGRQGLTQGHLSNVQGVRSLGPLDKKYVKKQITYIKHYKKKTAGR